MRTALLGTLAVALLAAAPAGAGESFVNWESPPVHPIDLTPNGNTLLAVNTADARLEVFVVPAAPALPIHVGAVPVGLDPVSVRARTDTEAWVVNRISDSVSVVDLTTRNVKATLFPGDEPADVIFAGSPQRAFVTVSMTNEVKVYDPANLAAAPTVIPIQGKDPRALATDGTRVFAAIFESGNRSMILPASVVSDPNGPYGGVNPPPNSGNALVPSLAPGLPAPPPTGLIVNREGTNWKDENQTHWDPLVTWALNTNDVAVIDVSTLSVGYQKDLLNIDMALAVQPGTGNVWVVGTYGPNEARFEPKARNGFERNRVAFFNPSNLNGGAPALDINTHLMITPPIQTYKSSVTQAEHDMSVADPRGIAFNAAGTAAYVSGMGSNNVAKIGAPASLQIPRIATIPVGQGPTGLVLDAGRNRLYCLNRFDATVSVIDTASDSEVGRVAFFDPTPQAIKVGRPLLYDAHRTSLLGNASCAGCHVDATRDTEAWDLGDPQGAMKALDVPCDAGLPFPGGCNDWHPMKGPMMTQTLIGAVGTEPLHWRGDRERLQAFTGGFTGLLGTAAPPSAQEMDQLAAFLATIRFPPNPFRTFTDGLPAQIPGYAGNPANGETLFNTAAVFTGGLRCVDCHSTPSGAGTTLVSGAALGEAQALKPPQLRDMYKKIGLDFTSMTNNRGYGFLHDGSADTLFGVLGRPGFTFAAGAAGISQRRDLEAFLLAFPTDTHPAVGTQLTIDGSNHASQAVIDQLAAMTALADTGVVGLVAKARVGGLQRGYAYLPGTGNLQSDRQAEVVTAVGLRGGAGAGAEVTFTVVPAGSETRIGIDRDLDEALDRDEIDAGSDPADPNSRPVSAPAQADADGDGVPDVVDNCVNLANAGQADADGDGVGDACDVCPNAKDAGQEDADGDGIGDACDPCPNGALVSSPLLRLRRLGSPAKALKLVGTMTVPLSPAIDPAGNGFRVVARDVDGATLLDATVPKGANWTADLTIPSWIYANPTGFAGVRRVVVTGIAGTPGAYRVKVVARGLAVTASAASMPLSAMVVFDVPSASTGQCGDFVFPGPAPACALNLTGTAIVCH